MRRPSGLILLLLIAWVSAALSHEVNPALLQITESSPGIVDIFWKRPVTEGRALRLEPSINHTAVDAENGFRVLTPQAEITRWHNMPLDPSEAEVDIAGLEHTITDVMLIVNFANGERIQTLLGPKKSSVQLAINQPLQNLSAYLTLGIKHILSGADHLLFVLGLLLLVRGLSALIKTITAFTVAHSLTLAPITLGVISPNVPLTEALVSLSIVFVAVEVVRVYRGRGGWMVRFPWLLAFIFGLLHGSAFGGELLKIGLPPDNILWALLLFNIGIEAGQLLFIAVIYAASWYFRHFLLHLPGYMKWITPYAIGSLGALWFLERLGVSLQYLNVS